MTIEDEDSHGNLSLFERDEDPPPPRRRPSRRSARPDVQIRRSRRRRLRGRIVPIIAVLIIVGVVVTGVTIVRHVVNGFAVKDYKGSGTGTVLVDVPAGSSGSEIAAVMVKNGVVASSQAFLNATTSQEAQAFPSGYFRMRHQMSGKSAVKLFLTSSTRVSYTVTITEGMTQLNILPLMATKLHIPLASLKKAAANVRQLGIPAGFTPYHNDAEGFLFPSTYQDPPRYAASDALGDLTSQFGTVVRKLNFVAAAKKLHLSAYQALIIASMIEAEAKYEIDRPRIARVVLNRLAAHMPLGFDSTSAYGARLIGQNPTKINFNLPAPYNTRKKLGLPPTPIGNPGTPSMSAAVTPAKGNWLYFVSSDATGHLLFTNSYPAFVKASATCKAKHWGCT